MRTILIPSALLVVALSGCAAATAAPPASTSTGAVVTLQSCGLDLTVDSPPRQAVTLEQGATELLLALGLGDRLIGTSYLTDAVAPEYADAYADVPVLADQYPTAEQLREAGPDFVYSMRASAFAADAVGDRAELVDLGVPAYLSANDCEDPDLVADEVGFDQIFAEITDLAAVFDVESRGTELVGEQQAVLTEVADAAPQAEGLDVAWIYSTINGAPIVAGNAGLPQTLTELAGAGNAFEDLDAQWSETSWDEIAQRDPDVLVLADLSRGLTGDSADDKIATLRSDTVTAQLSAVRSDQLVAIPATEMDPSVRSINALAALSGALVEYAEVDK
ncbi:iron complex transport system substrate-binding protein [Promicromonospora umidemergens]|uniref:ABC transporter substrate-binding protein n=1 Tax=Promicromonospora umidemergens TaxID=629679 RepID=A0ABP8XBZ9_9MICO|nr:ABC transporter substrate-binding protein [Promicromonospora umidemergens]MCP2281781.1 iron complex transport system substrate-binding protein [Promicromonospora umidemergens]